MTAPPRPAATAVQEFDRHGYALIPNALSPSLRTSLRQAAEEMLSSTTTRGRDRGSDGKDGFRGCIALNPSAFLPLVANTRVLPTVVDLLSPNIHILSSHLIALPSISPGHPRSIRTPERPGWHRDMFGVTADLAEAHTPRMAIKCAYFLTDLTPDAGVTMFLPGSHRHTTRPDIPSDQIDPSGAITPPVSTTGTDAVLFENRTWHAGGVNTSGHPRIAIMIQYGYRWLAPVDDPVPELLELTDLTGIQRQLLGAADRNPDGSLAKGRGAEPLRRWWDRRQAEHDTTTTTGTAE
ncbi:MAG: phytanoyl-CoA dioxygenase family protein [Pseudonocardiaceae bacterium]